MNDQNGRLNDDNELLNHRNQNQKNNKKSVSDNYISQIKNGDLKMKETHLNDSKIRDSEASGICN